MGSCLVSLDICWPNLTPGKVEPHGEHRALTIKARTPVPFSGLGLQNGSFAFGTPFLWADYGAIDLVPALQAASATLLGQHDGGWVVHVCAFAQVNHCSRGSGRLTHFQDAEALTTWGLFLFCQSLWFPSLSAGGEMTTEGKKGKRDSGEYT